MGLPRADGQLPDARRAVPALILGVVAISFAAIFFRKASPTHPLTSAAIRLLVASVLLSPFVTRAQRRQELSPQVAKHALWGGLFYAVHFGTWVWSLELTTVAASVTLVTATPVLLAIIAVITGRDRPSPRLWISLVLASLGVAIIGGFDQSSSSLIGNGLALAGAAAMAGYLLMVRRLGAIDVLAFGGLTTLCAGSLLMIIALATGVGMRPASLSAFGFLVMSALIPQLVGHNALTWALRHASPTTVGTATLGEPVGATLLAWLILAEVPPASTLAGCAITLVAVGIALRGRVPVSH